MPFMQIGEKMRIGYDPDTGERGTQMRLVNETGSASVKGTVVAPDSSVDQAVVAIVADTPDPIGVIAEDGVADGSEVWCWMPGSLCQVLLEDGTAATRDNWVYVSQNDNGRADATTAAPPPGGGISELDTHFQEFGHSAESQASGTDVLCLIHFHVN